MEIFLLTVNKLTTSWIPYSSELITPQPGTTRNPSAYKFVGWSAIDSGLICVAPINVGHRRDVIFHRDIISLAKISDLVGGYDKSDIFGAIDTRGLICLWKSQEFGKTVKELQVPAQDSLGLDLANHLK
jgi:hypothetical protein